jgi:hypothetical protein
MSRLLVTVELNPDRPDARVALVLEAYPAPDASGPALGVLYLPLETVKVLKMLGPALQMFGPDLELEVVWAGVPIDVEPDAKLAKAARLLRKTVGLLT